MKRNGTILGLSVALAVLVCVPWSPAYGDRAAQLIARAHAYGPVEMIRPPSALVQLAATVSRGPAWERAAFARTAILTMAEQYRQEVGRARSQSYADPQLRRKTSRWSSATLEYLSRLYGTADHIDESSTIEVIPDAGQSVQLIVNGAPVVLSGPHIDDPNALGREIVKAFCRLNPCVLDTLIGHQAAASIREAPDDSRSGWSFADGAGTTFVTEDGIHFMFASVSDRKRKQQAALALTHDVRKVADALMDASDEGYDIDWDRVRISDAPVAGEHKLIVNRRGDYLLLRLPSLGRSSAFFRTSLSWIQARMEGRKLELYVPRAENVLGPLLGG